MDKNESNKMVLLAHNNLNFWSDYEYENRPLAFLNFNGIHEPLNEQQVLNLLRQFDIWYGNTDQETTDYALEFQLLTRNLIHSGCLLVNPYYLEVEDIIESGELSKILTANQYQFFLAARSSFMGS